MQKTDEWGDYFPFQISPFAYNETIAQEYFPLTKEQTLQIGSRWRDEQETQPLKTTFIPPPDIREVNDNIYKQTLQCEITGRKYKIIPQELSFYRKMNLPIPRIHADQRHYIRLKFHNHYKLWREKCAKCNTDIETIYPPESQEKVFCEKCYQQEVF